MSGYKIPITRIDQVLQTWEQEARFTGLSQTVVGQNLPDKLTRKSGPVRNWRAFRKFLLRTRPETDFDKSRFFYSDTLNEHMSPEDYDALALFGWTQSSRKVFHLNREVSSIFRGTSLHTLSWSEVLWPFDSFAITLEEPLLIDDNFSCDCIVVCRLEFEDDGWFTLISAYGPPKASFQMIPEAKFRAIAKSIRKKRLSKAGRTLLATIRRYKTRAPTRLHFGATDNTRVVESADWLSNRKLSSGVDLDEKRLEAIRCSQGVFRIVASLCQYLASLQPKSRHATAVKSAKVETIDPKAITTGADITVVRNRFRLTQAEWDALEGKASASGGEVAPHWRRAHWRRPRGKGNDPTAEKTVWVKPTLVRRDRLPEVGLPGGSIIDVEGPKKREGVE